MEVCIKWRMHKCSIQCTITTCGKMLELFMFSLDRQMTQHDVFQRVVETTKWLVRRCLSFVSELIKGSLWWHRYLCDLGGLCSNISRLNYDCPVFDCVVLIYFCRMLFLSTLPSMVFQPSEIAFYASHWDELLRKVLCVVAARIDMQYSHTYYIYIWNIFIMRICILLVPAFPHLQTAFVDRKQWSIWDCSKGSGGFCRMLGGVTRGIPTFVC